MPLNSERIAVAMSGGVDSSVAVVLLQDMGFSPEGFTLKLWDQAGPDDACAAAKTVAEFLGIPHTVIDCRAEFETEILWHCWQEYASGRTPNPCVVCNPQIKFGWLMRKALNLGCSRFATGHYARIVSDESAGCCRLLRGIDRSKDQSYFLFRLSRDQLARTLLPLGGLTKAWIREIAVQRGLPNAGCRESQDACIAMAGERFGELLRTRFKAVVPSGHIISTAGEILGDHTGIHHFTIGQRRGLGIALGKPAYVSAIHAPSNTVTVSCNKQDLLARSFSVDGLHWIDPADCRPHINGQVQIRYLHKPAAAKILRPDLDTAVIEFDEPQRAITPGQSAVIYREDQVLGGGRIGSVLTGNEEEPACRR